MAGYDAAGWPASTWVLHAMYENPDLRGFGTHDDLQRRRLESGDAAPLTIGEVTSTHSAPSQGPLSVSWYTLDTPGGGSPGRRIWRDFRTSLGTVITRLTSVFVSHVTTGSRRGEGDSRALVENR